MAKRISPKRSEIATLELVTLNSHKHPACAPDENDDCSPCAPSECNPDTCAICGDCPPYYSGEEECTPSD